MKNAFFIFSMLIVISSCSGKNPEGSKSVILQPDKSKTALAANKQTGKMDSHPGKKVYESACLACHMREGQGVPRMHPPLTNSEFVNGDPDKLITIILKGLSGKVEIKGVVYNGIMPPMANLSDKQIADVLTYVRGSFGNNSGEILPEQVMKIRNK